MATYIGFNTVNQNTAPFNLTDIEIIKRDLMNAFHTRKGERVMMPNYGTIVWDLLMDPADTITTAQIEEDAQNIILQDPRVEFIESSVTELDHAYSLELTLRFFPSNVIEKMVVEFEKQMRDSY